MAVLEIQVPDGVAFFSQRVKLDGVFYTLRLAYNQRADRWYLSLADANEDPIILGRKVVPGRTLWGRVADVRLPPGQLYAYNPHPRDATAPGYTELGPGKRVTLTYFDATEFQ